MAKGITDGEAVKRFLRNTPYVRITVGDAWLVAGEGVGCQRWFVYRRPYRARKIETLYDDELRLKNKVVSGA